MPPDNKIPTHKHLYEDDVIFVHKGAVRISLAGQWYDAGTGTTVFIPRGLRYRICSIRIRVVSSTSSPMRCYPNRIATTYATTADGPTTLLSWLLLPMTTHTACRVPSGAHEGDPTPVLASIWVKPVQLEPL